VSALSLNIESTDSMIPVFVYFYIGSGRCPHRLSFTGQSSGSTEPGRWGL